MIVVAKKYICVATVHHKNNSDYIFIISVVGKIEEDNFDHYLPS